MGKLKYLAAIRILCFPIYMIDIVISISLLWNVQKLMNINFVCPPALWLFYSETLITSKFFLVKEDCYCVTLISHSRPGRTEAGFRPQVKVYSSGVLQNAST